MSQYEIGPGRPFPGTPGQGEVLRCLPMLAARSRPGDTPDSKLWFNNSGKLGTLRAVAEKSMNSASRFSDFIIPGYSRCGTTWLYQVLKAHPGIYLPVRKEINFFNRNYDRGIDWYAEYYQDKPGGVLAGDISPVYAEVPSVPGRIHDLLPHAKILIVLRNPVDRIYSIYNQLIRDGQLSMSLSEWIDQDFATQISDVHTQYYIDTVSRYLTLFGPDNVRCLIYEDARRDVREYLAGILRFLGLEHESFLEKHQSLWQERVNPTVQPVSANVHRVMQRINRFLRHRHITVLDRGLDAGKRWYSQRMTRHVRAAPIGEVERHRVQDKYRDDVAQLSGLLERDLLREWCFAGADAE